MVLEIYSDIPTDNPEEYPYKIINEESVKQAITTILTTFDGLRLFRPELDLSLEDLLWDPLDDETELAVNNHIIIGLEIYEPRIDIEDVEFTRDERNETLFVTIYYSIKGFGTDTKEQIIQLI